MKNTLKLITQAVNVALDKIRAEIPHETRELLYEFTEEDFLIKTEIEATKEHFDSIEEVIWYNPSGELGRNHLFSLDDGEPMQIEHTPGEDTYFQYNGYNVTFSRYNKIGIGYFASDENAPNIKLVKIESQRNEDDWDTEAMLCINLTEQEVDDLLNANLEIEGSLIAKNLDTGEMAKTFLQTYARTCDEVGKAKTFIADLGSYSLIADVDSSGQVIVLKNYDLQNCENSNGTNQLFIYTMCHEVEYIRIYKVTKS